MLLKILVYAAILIWGWIAIAQMIVRVRKAKRTEGLYGRQDYKRRT